MIKQKFKLIQEMILNFINFDKNSLYMIYILIIISKIFWKVIKWLFWNWSSIEMVIFRLLNYLF